MDYADGQVARIGDRVDLGGAMTGIVRVLVGEDACDPAFAADEWAYLDDGVLVESPEAGLIHYPIAMSGRLVLIARADPQV